MHECDGTGFAVASLRIWQRISERRRSELASRSELSKRFALRSSTSDATRLDWARWPIASPVKAQASLQHCNATWVAAWSRPPRLADLASPRPNRFIPTELGLKSKGGAPLLGHVKPSLLLNSDALRLHFLQDATFGRPKAFAFVSLRTPQLYETPAVALQAELYQSLTLALALTRPSSTSR